MTRIEDLVFDFLQDDNNRFACSECNGDVVQSNLVKLIETLKSEWEKASFERGKAEGVKEVLEMIPYKIESTDGWYYASTKELKSEITKKFNL